MRYAMALAVSAMCLTAMSAAAMAADASAVFTAGDITVRQPWSRATPPGAPTAVGYLTLTNHGSAPDTLLGGTTPAAAKVEVHTMTKSNGVMTMRALPRGLTIAPGQTVTMKPEGAYHLMLVGVKTALKAGATIPITLDFAKAGKLTAQFPVAGLGATMPPGHANP